MTSPGGTVTDLLGAARQHMRTWRFADAWRLLIEAHGLLDHGVPVGEDDAVDLVLTLAAVCRELGELDHAYSLLDPLVTDLTATRGLGDPATVQANAVLGAVHHDSGELAAAQSCYGLVADSGLDLAGPAGRAVLVTAAQQGLLLVDLGKPLRGAARLRSAHVALRRVYGAGDPDQLRVAGELGVLLWRLGVGRLPEPEHVSEGRSLVRAAAHDAQLHLGARHPLTQLMQEASRHVKEGRVLAAPPPHTPRRRLLTLALNTLCAAQLAGMPSVAFLRRRRAA